MNFYKKLLVRLQVCFVSFVVVYSLLLTSSEPRPVCRSKRNRSHCSRSLPAQFRKRVRTAEEEEPGRFWELSSACTEPEPGLKVKAADAESGWGEFWFWFGWVSIFVRALPQNQVRLGPNRAAAEHFDLIRSVRALPTSSLLSLRPYARAPG